MADFNTNIRRIRSEAMYGKDVREAIAEGLTQADANAKSIVDSRVAAAVNDLNAIVTQLEERANNMTSDTERRINNLKDRVTTVKSQIDNEEIYVNLKKIDDGTYLMEIS